MSKRGEEEGVFLVDTWAEAYFHRLSFSPVTVFLDTIKKVRFFFWFFFFRCDVLCCVLFHILVPEWV